MIYLRARYYVPNLGVFTGLDPLETTNRYRYVNGNPINLVDPLGLYACKDENNVPFSVACEQVETALTYIPTFRAAAEATISNNAVNFEATCSFIQDNFGFTIAGFNAANKLEPLLKCTEIEKLVGDAKRPAKLSLIRAVAAMIHIAARFESEGFGANRLKDHVGNGTIIQLVADQAISDPDTKTKIGPYTGLVPVRDNPPSNSVFLGSEIQMYAIVHELGHAFDRKKNLAPSSVINGLRLSYSLNPLTLTALYNFTGATPPNLSKVLSDAGLGGRANGSDDSVEMWADMFMTWILDGRRINVITGGAQVPGPIGWTQPTNANRPQGAFKRAYTKVAIRNLTSGLYFPSRTTVTETTNNENITPVPTMTPTPTPNNDVLQFVINEVFPEMGQW